MHETKYYIGNSQTHRNEQKSRYGDRVILTKQLMGSIRHLWGGFKGVIRFE